MNVEETRLVCQDLGKWRSVVSAYPNGTKAYIAPINAEELPNKQPLLLTPLIRQGLIELARNRSHVDPKYFLNITSHSGFLTVDEKYDSNLFFWFFPHGKLNNEPWIIWLQGGPGGSSLVGAFDENGPFSYSLGKLQIRESAWSRDYSILYIDNPVGAGYSFTKSDNGYAQDMATYTNHLYSALQQFMTIFPELRKAPLYIAGESYAGHYVPAFGMKIMQENPSSSEAVNLKGLIMGNPILERENVANLSQIFYQWGLIDIQGLLAVKYLQDAYIDAIQGNDPELAFETRGELLDKLYYISAQKQNYNVLDDELSFYDFIKYLQVPEVKAAMHVGDMGFGVSQADAAKKLIPDFLAHMRPIIEKLLESYRIMIYCGQLDLVAPCVPNAEARRKNWRWSKKEEFLKAPRLPWTYNNSIAGYVKSGGGFTEVLVRGSGHLVPLDKGPQSRKLVSIFIENEPFPYDPIYNNKAEYTPDYKTTSDLIKTSYLSAMIASLILNVLLVCGFVAGLVYYRTKLKRFANYMYSVQSDSVQSSAV